MARCNTNQLIKKVTSGVINPQKMEIDFAVLNDTNSCMDVITSNYMSLLNTTVSDYDPLSKPEDVFNCMTEGCFNTGTLYLTGSEENAIGAKFRIPYESEEYYAGVSTFYVYLPKSGSFDVIYQIGDVSDPGLVNSDSYVKTITATEPGYYSVVIDFSEPPTTVNGTGWQENEDGAIVQIAIQDQGSTPGNTITYGISSIYMYGSMEEFQANDTVKLGCVTGVDGDITFDLIDDTCWKSVIDQGSITYEKTITATAMTPNAWKLSPLIGRGESTTSWFPRNITRKIQGTETIDGINYGYIQIQDYYLDECAFLTVALEEECNASDAMFNRLTTPNPVRLNKRQMIVLDGTTTKESDAGKILFNEALIGKTVLVSYPQEQEVEEFTASKDNIDERRTRMMYIECMEDGTETKHEFPNTIVLTLPTAISSTEITTRTFTIRIMPDSNGVYEKIQTVKK